MALMAENFPSDAPKIWCDQYLLRILTKRRRNTISPLSRQKIILNLCLPCPDHATLSLGRTRRLCGGCSSFTPVHVSNILHKGRIALNTRTVIIAEGLWFWRESKGLCVRKITSYPTYIRGKVRAFNSCSFPRNATDKVELVQFPTSFATVGSEDPREGAPWVLKRQRTPREWEKECLLIWHVSHVNGKTQVLSRVQNLSKLWCKPNITQNPPPRLKVGQQDFEGLLWGQRIRNPDPLYIRAQGPSRGELLSRTTSYSAPHEMPEERGKLSVGVGQRKKLSTL